MAKSQRNLKIRKKSVIGGLGFWRVSKKAFIFACVYGPCAAGGPADCEKISQTVEISFRKLTSEKKEEKKALEIIKAIFKGSSEESLRFRLREHIDHYPLLAKFCGLRLDAEACKKLKVALELMKDLEGTYQRETQAVGPSKPADEELLQRLKKEQIRKDLNDIQEIRNAIEAIKEAIKGIEERETSEPPKIKHGKSGSSRDLSQEAPEEAGCGACKDCCEPEVCERWVAGLCVRSEDFETELLESLKKFRKEQGLETPTSLLQTT